MQHQALPQTRLFGVSAADADSGSNAIITYSIVEDAEGVCSDLYIDRDGNVYSNNSLPWKTICNVTIRASDGNRTAECVVNLRVEEMTNGTTESPTNGNTESPTDGTTESPTDGTTESPTNGTTESPTNGTTESPTNDNIESRTGELKTFFKAFELVSYQYQYYWLK